MARLEFAFPLMIAWKVNRLDPGLASVRYRCIYPAESLRSAGCDSLILEKNEVISDSSSIKAMVLTKAFELRDLRLARRAHRAGIPVFLDLCDNVFVEEYGAARNLDIRNNVFDIARICTAITAPTEALAEVIRSELGLPVPVVVIPDTIETKELIDVCHTASLRTVGAAIRRLGPEDSQWRLVRVTCRVISMGTKFRRRWFGRGFPAALAQSYRRWTDNHEQSSRIETGGGRPRPGPAAAEIEAGRSPAKAKCDGSRKTLIWFGNSGSGHGIYGLRALQAIGPAIKSVFQDTDLCLVVVSNDRNLFEELVAPLPIPTTYVEWTASGCHELIARADVCLLPNSRDEFSVVKSANRAVEALHLGTPVVATFIPALEPLRSCIMLDDFEHGIRTYLNDPIRRELHLGLAERILESHYSIRAVGRLWSRTLLKTGE